MSWSSSSVNNRRMKILRFSVLVCFHGFVLTARILIKEKPITTHPLSTLSLTCFLYKLKALKQNFIFFNDAINFVLLDLLPFLHRLLACITFSLISPEKGSIRWVIFNNAAVVKCLGMKFLLKLLQHSQSLPQEKKLAYLDLEWCSKGCYQLKIHTAPHPESMSFSLLKAYKNQKYRGWKRMITEEIRGRVPGRREHARLNDELNRDELRTDDKKMEHNAAGLWKILKAVKKIKQEEIGMRKHKTMLKNISSHCWLLVSSDFLVDWYCVSKTELGAFLTCPSEVMYTIQENYSIRFCYLHHALSDLRSLNPLPFLFFL